MRSGNPLDYFNKHLVVQFLSTRSTWSGNVRDIEETELLVVQYGMEGWESSQMDNLTGMVLDPYGTPSQSWSGSESVLE